MSKNRAEIYAKEFEEGVRLCYEFAIYLIECAEILQAKGRHSPARALAIHAEEELGKALMLLDEIRDSRPWITEKRWEDEYRDHEHKARRARLGIQKNIVEITEWMTTITLDGCSKPTRKVVTEGEQMKRYAEYDIETKYRSLYVDHGPVHGKRQWISPLTLKSFSTDSKEEIGIAKICYEAVKKEAAQHGLSL